MGTSCSVYVEFRRAPTPEEVAAIRERLQARTFMIRPAPAEQLEVQALDDFAPVMEGFSGYAVDDTGHLDSSVYDGARTGKPIGCVHAIPSGAIGHLICPGRYWSKTYPEGPFPEHAVILLSLLNDPMVKRCWYVPHGDWHWPPAVSKVDVLAMLDDFINIGTRHKGK